MDEFPVSNLEKRLGWGIACGFCAMLLNISLPFLLLAIGVRQTWPVQQGPLGGMGIGILLMTGMVFSGLAGFVAGVVLRGMRAVMTTLICLLLPDILMMGLSFWLHFIAAAIKVMLIILVVTQFSKSHEAPTSGHADDLSSRN